MKTLKYLFIAALAVFCFNACEDVPAPYDIPSISGSSSSGSGSSESTPEGDGTLGSPYNPAGANAYISTLEDDVNSDKAIYVKGIICEIKEAPNSQFGNATFYISADGKTTGEKFYVYRCYNLGNKKFTDNDVLNVGDEVIIYGKVVNYRGSTPETVQNGAYIYSRSDATDDEISGNIYLDEKFADGLGSFTTAQIVNDYAWKHEVYNDKAYAKVSGYANGASQDAESWLISPAMDFTNETTASISFDYVINKGDVSLAAANHKLMITDSYTGDFYTTNWEEIDFGAQNDNSWNFRNTGNIAIPEAFMGKATVVIAFKYLSTTSASSTWEVKNVLVTGEKGGTVEGGDTPAPGGPFFTQDFSTSLGDFAQTNSNPDVKWINDYSSAVVKGYDSSSKTYNAGVSYFVSPAINLGSATKAFVTVEHVICYANSSTIKNDHQVLISTDYTGDATEATWTVLDFVPVGSSSFTFKSTSFNIPADFVGEEKVYIAFKYTSTSSYASTWEVKSITVEEGEAQTEEEETGEVMTVAQALAAYTGTAKPAIVKGYIVGYIPEMSIDDAIFSTNATIKTNILLADTPDETNITKCIPVQLPSGDIRSKVNLQDNPGNYKKFVTLTGSIEKNFGVTGLKAVSEALFEGGDTGNDDTTGDDENEGETPAAGTIASVIAAGPGDATINGTIIATYTRGFLVNDGTGSILVYLGSNSYSKGDKVTVSGTTTTYAGMLQFGNTATVTKTGTGIVTTPTPKEMSASEMDAYLNNPTIEYVSYTGTLVISGYYYNIEIEGAATAQGSLSYPNDGLVDTALDGKKVIVTGYTIGVSKNMYVNTMVTSVIAADGGSDDDTTGDDTTGDDTTGDDTTGDDTTGDDTTGDDTTTIVNAISVADLIAAYNNGTTGEISVTGYIVGFASRGTSLKPNFTAEGAAATNIVIADTPDETDATKCIAIELPANSDIRTSLNLSNNPDCLGKKVAVTGTLEKYFGTAGIKAPTAYTIE